MDESRFDAITRILGISRSRRLALRSVAGVAVAAGLARLGPGGATAKNKKSKHRRKWKKLQKNAFGCVNVGGACRGKDANCCSGICEGLPKYGSKKDTSRCVAHNELDCALGADTCQALAPCGPGGSCYQTTGQSSFCAAFAFCRDCQRDADCEPEFGEGAACGAGCDFCPTGTVCAPPLV